ncbi:MAG: hypothetical protein HWD58_11935 [Bacteroidota bacterium]|nr:MAG: hypothetical protein HWD58_11935 [Bacteroidota bacterium]
MMEVQVIPQLQERMAQPTIRQSLLKLPGIAVVPVVQVVLAGLGSPIDSKSLTNCCSNVTAGGSIGYDETQCGTSVDPSLIQDLTPASGGTGALNTCGRSPMMEVQPTPQLPAPMVPHTTHQ